jgi:hypothetical protein
MPRRSTPQKTLYERKFPHHVTPSSPPAGFGQRLNAMHDWCAARCGSHGDNWASFGATFYFADAGIADEFKKAFV